LIPLGSVIPLATLIVHALTDIGKTYTDMQNDEGPARHHARQARHSVNQHPVQRTSTHAHYAHYAQASARASAA
jgi:hypothetical protein